jgi:hypothetical protein
MRLFKCMSPDEGGGSGNAAGQNSGGSQVTSGSAGSSTASGTTPDGIVKAPGQDKTLAQLQEENKYLRPEIFNDVLKRERSARKEELENLRQGMTNDISSVKKLLEEIRSQSQVKKTKEDESPESQDLIKVRRELDAIKEAHAKAIKDLETATSREKTTRFETKVKEALVRNGCTKPDFTYLMVAPDLQMDENGEVFTHVESTYGQKEKLLVDEYVKRVLKSEKLPEMFQSAIKQGAPAGGDTAGNVKYKYRGSQLKDAEFYKKNLDSIREAIDAKQVDWKN